MADTLSSSERSAVMSAVRSRRNKSTEQRLVEILRLHGVKGWRRNATFFGNPDFVFRKKRVAVFVDGCFWHGCPRHCRIPSTNRHYWETKINRNRVRDRAVDRKLRADGWKVVRIWEHALRVPSRAIRRLRADLNATSELRERNPSGITLA